MGREIKRIIIWGAGRIGRGFLADIFQSAGYQVVLVDDSEELIQDLKQAGKYTVVHAPATGSRHDYAITPFLTLHTSQVDEIANAFQGTDIMAVAVYPHSFQLAATQMAPLLKKRLELGTAAPLNILVCSNLAHAADSFRFALQAALTPAVYENMISRLGIVGTLVIRFASESPVDDPLLVWTNGYWQLPIDGSSFIGRIPQLDFLVPVADMQAEETRKLYTYNMLHTLLAYHGYLQGCSMLSDCLENEAIRQEGQEALQESSLALQAAFGFSRQEMESWNAQVWEHSSSPVLGGPVLRMGGEPLRKLSRNDRLVGPALLARQNGIPVPHLIRAIAAGFHFNPPGDPQAQQIQRKTSEGGIRRAVEQICELGEDDQELVDDIVLAYHRIPLENTWQGHARRAYWTAFEYEKSFRGCGQCTATALMETLGIFDDEVFNAATALSGGVGLAGDATCSALLGAVLVFGMLYPRRRSLFNGDRDNKYRAYAMTQRLRQEFIHEYGSITCQEIHRYKYGRSFDLMDPAQRQPFEDAGAHGDLGCTLVAAKSARWAMEIIAGEKIKDYLAALEES